MSLREWTGVRLRTIRYCRRRVKARLQFPEAGTRTHGQDRPNNHHAFHEDAKPGDLGG